MQELPASEGETDGWYSQNFLYADFFFFGWKDFGRVFLVEIFFLCISSNVNIFLAFSPETDPLKRRGNGCCGLIQKIRDKRSRATDWAAHPTKSGLT